MNRLVGWSRLRDPDRPGQPRHGGTATIRCPAPSHARIRIAPIRRLLAFRGHTQVPSRLDPDGHRLECLSFEEVQELLAGEAGERLVGPELVLDPPWPFFNARSKPCTVSCRTTLRPSVSPSVTAWLRTSIDGDCRRGGRRVARGFEASTAWGEEPPRPVLLPSCLVAADQHPRAALSASWTSA